MKKKFSVNSKDKEVWESFIKKLSNIEDKDFYLEKTNTSKKKVLKIDLHGLSLSEANKSVKEFIDKASKNGYKKLLIITGKGLRSKVYNDPYKSEKMNVLKYAVPEYIKNDQNLIKKISKITKADIKDGDEGAFYIFLKSKRL